MKENEITGLFGNHPNLEGLLRAFGDAGSERIRLEGLTGSSKAIIVAGVFLRTMNTHLVIIPEKEDAAYFYNDLVSLVGDDAVFFFPSTYKRSVQYWQTEPANIVLRTEVLNHLASGKRKSIIVSYPESVMELVVSKSNLKKNTFHIKKGDKISLEFLEEMLQEYHFTRTDFVYEPGQYSIRGSIADLFSFSSENPYRIDFFGEEVDTIRSFNTDDQLSVSILNQVSIIPNLQDISVEEPNDTFNDFIPPSSSIWIEDAGFIREKINNIFNQTRQREEGSGHPVKKEIIITGNRFIEECEKFRILEFGRQSFYTPDLIFEYHTEPQPSFKKNFELLSDKLLTC